MFTNVIDNRKMNVATDGTGGGTSDNIIVSGFDVPIKNTPVSSPNPVADPIPNDFIAIDEKTDVILKDAIASKYSDLSLVKLNKEGDVVNTEGKVLITKADLAANVEVIKTERLAKADTYLKGIKTVDVEGRELPIEADGSVKDADGNVILTKEQLLSQIMEGDEYLKEPEEDVSIYAQAEAISGLQLLDEEGNPLEFEETPQGLAQRDLHIARQEGNRIAKDYIASFFGEYPDLETAYYYYKLNGSLQGFGQQTNHEGITLALDNEQQHFDIIVESEMARGYNREQAVKRAELYKKNDMAYETAKEGLAFLVEREKAEKINLANQYQAEQARIEKAQQEYWTNVATKLNSGKILDYTIPENIRIVNQDGTVNYKSRRDFYNYISTPVKNGMTQAQVDAQSESLDVKLFNDYLRFAGYNMDYIVQQKVKQNMVSDLKQRFNRDAIPSRRIVVTPAASKSNNDKIAI